MRRREFLAASAALPATLRRARAAEAHIRIAVFNVASALPFYVAQERGLLARAGINAELVPLQAPPLIVQAMVANAVDGATNLVTLEGANIDARRPGSAQYIALTGQSVTYRMEQFLVPVKSSARNLRDLKGARIMSAPGPANIGAARAVLQAVGLQDGRDYTISEQQMGVQVGELAAGRFDAAYTLEPVATTAELAGVARLLEGGVISTYLLGGGEAWAAGAALSQKFITEQPDLARRFADIWSQASKIVQTDPTARDLLVSHMNTSPAVAKVMPLQDFRMVADMSAKDLQDFQKFVDLGVAQGVVNKPIDIHTMLAKLPG